MQGTTDDDFLARACELAVESVGDGGGPFGAIVVRDGAIVATGTNRVTLDDDPTAHAEVIALRSAGIALGTYELDGCIVYASCRPCPMCLTAAWWARVDRIVYAAESDAAASVGFDDARFWAGIRDQADEPVSPEHIDHSAAAAPFAAWEANADREEY